MAANEKTQRTSDQRAVDARKQKEKAFFELAGRFRSSNDLEKMRDLGDKLGRFIFGQVATGSKL